jgi:hypothetical protein
MSKSSIEVAHDAHPMITRIAGGKKSVTLSTAECYELNGAYWDGGSKTGYRAYDENGAQVSLPRHGGAPQFGGSVGVSVKLAPLGAVDERVTPIAFLVVCHMFRGKNLAPSVYMHPSRFELFEADLPPAPELTPAQREVLRVTDGYKSSYRKQEFARTFDPNIYDATRTQLREMKLLRKNNAITPEGVNALR